MKVAQDHTDFFLSKKHATIFFTVFDVAPVQWNTLAMLKFRSNSHTHRCNLSHLHTMIVFILLSLFWL